MLTLKQINPRIPTSMLTSFWVCGGLQKKPFFVRVPRWGAKDYDMVDGDEGGCWFLKNPLPRACCCLVRSFHPGCLIYKSSRPIVWNDKNQKNKRRFGPDHRRDLEVDKPLVPFTSQVLGPGKFQGLDFCQRYIICSFNHLGETKCCNFELWIWGSALKPHRLKSPLLSLRAPALVAAKKYKKWSKHHSTNTMERIWTVYTETTNHHNLLCALDVDFVEFQTSGENQEMCLRDADGDLLRIPHCILNGQRSRLKKCGSQWKIDHSLQLEFPTETPANTPGAACPRKRTEVPWILGWQVFKGPNVV